MWHRNEGMLFKLSTSSLLDGYSQLFSVLAEGCCNALIPLCREQIQQIRFIALGVLIVVTLE